MLFKNTVVFDQKHQVICFSLASDIQITLLNLVMPSVKKYSLAEMKLVHLIRLQGFYGSSPQSDLLLREVYSHG